MLRSSLFIAVVAAAFTTTCSATTCPRCSEVTADVVVLGGGAAGSYVAAQLTDIHGKNVMVIGTASRLGGGHVDTISLPGLDRPIDFGVLIYHKLDFVGAFFNRYGVNVTSDVATLAVEPSFLDYKTAQPVNITQYSAEEQAAALARWVKFGLKYKKYVYPKYDLPSPLGDAAPLARPFLETVKELKLESIVLSIGERHTANDLLGYISLASMLLKDLGTLEMRVQSRGRNAK